MNDRVDSVAIPSKPDASPASHPEIMSAANAAIAVLTRL
jgi:hypothetical protein